MHEGEGRTRRKDNDNGIRFVKFSEEYPLSETSFLSSTMTLPVKAAGPTSTCFNGSCCSSKKTFSRFYLSFVLSPKLYSIVRGERSKRQASRQEKNREKEREREREWR